MDQAKKSSILRNANVIQQSNVHSAFESDFQDFTPNSHPKPEKLFNIGVASVDSSSPLKGADLIPEILTKLKLEHISFNLLELAQFPKTQSGYMQFWNDIDCLLVLSRADNSPNVIHEARIAGVPIIATNVGGIPELIDSSHDFLFDFDEHLIDSVCKAITKIARREKVSREKDSTQALKGAAKDPLEALLKVYSFNS
jgi:glycosyltransferase involved in cell wall biosynthesis